MTTLICDCNHTLALQPELLSAALNEKLTLHSTLCRRQVASYVKALESGQEVLVACTQEAPLFHELAEQSQRGQAVRFVNIREMGGWSRDAAQASPKIAALLALARLSAPEPVASVSYKSSGRVLIIGALGAAERAAALLGEAHTVTLFSQGAGDLGAAQERRFPVLSGQIQSLTGYLGAFELRWQTNNPIDLDLCTRCNACLSACPHDAIGLDYQVDLAQCEGARACVKACQAAAAIDFNRTPQDLSDSFDLVLDLRATCAFTQQALPQGYFSPGPGGTDMLTALLQLRTLVGEFDKPRFFDYRQKLCAHSRNDKIGCSACIDLCSAGALRSDFKRQRILVESHLCIGCGTCSSVCPSGAIAYAYPRASDQGVKLKTLLASYHRGGGKNAALLLHSQGMGAQLLSDLGRAAQLEKGLKNGTHGVPARVLPLALWHTSSSGLELWLTALAYGASQVWLLMTDEQAPQEVAALRAQMAVAQAILSGLGYTGTHFAMLHARDARDLAALDHDLQAACAQAPTHHAGFAVQRDKRATLALALDHLISQAPALTGSAARQTPVETVGYITLPSAGSPLGALHINQDACTLCLSCMNACPAGALSDNAQTPQLNFIEKNCLQCGLCVKTCPEKALSLWPRLNLAAPQTVQLNAMPPYTCVRCGKPFATSKAIEGMLGKLAEHSMFQGEARERLKMCADCRVIDMHTSPAELKITDFLNA